MRVGQHLVCDGEIDGTFADAAALRVQLQLGAILRARSRRTAPLRKSTMLRPATRLLSTSLIPMPRLAN
jgi:hypothetical protein